MEIGLLHYIIVSIVIMSVGVFGALARRSLIAILVSVQLIFIAASINIAAASAYLFNTHSCGTAWVVMLLVLSCVETAVGLVIAIALFQHRRIFYADAVLTGLNPGSGSGV